MPRYASLAAAAMAIAVLATVGCNTEPLDGVSAETDFELYEPGDDIVVTLTNESDSDVTYWACPPRWDRKTDDGYERFEMLVGCTDEVTSVPASGSVDLHYDFPAGQPLGTWRIVILAGNGPSPDEIYTNDFEMVVTEN